LRGEVIDPVLTANRGRVANTGGDCLLVEFASAVDAVRAAIEIQRATAVRNADFEADSRIDFRIGVHFGPAILSRLGWPTHQQITASGAAVNVASRLLEVAKQQHCRLVVSEDLFAAAQATPGAANVDSEAIRRSSRSRPTRPTATTREVWRTWPAPGFSIPCM
jgi:class 3 adenylate cyclase